MILEVSIPNQAVVLATLEALGPRIADRIVRRSVRNAANVILAEARRVVPRRSGRLRRSLRVRSSGRVSRSGPAVIRADVQTGAAWFTGPTYYGAFVEFGHRIGRRLAGHRSRRAAGLPDTRAAVPGRHYVERAFSATATSAAVELVTSIQEGIDREGGA